MYKELELLFAKVSEYLNKIQALLYYYMVGFAARSAQSEDAVVTVL